MARSFELQTRLQNCDGETAVECGASTGRADLRASATQGTAEVFTEYSAAHRGVEIIAIVAFGGLAACLSWRLATETRGSQLWIIGVAAFAGYVAADFISGVVHWLFDTWGSVDTPLLGRSFIRPFREHHADAMSITRHDFIETNGNNCVASVPVLAVACFIPLETGLGVLATAFVLFLSLGVFATNQFHKWAHVENPGRIVGRLQRWHLILPREHHAVHHSAPYATHYCITTGWLNPILRATEFYRRAERVITVVTGVEPREDEASTASTTRRRASDGGKGEEEQERETVILTLVLRRRDTDNSAPRRR